MKIKIVLASLILSTALITGCSSNEIGESKDVNQDKIYVDYYINHTEGDENVDITCQFRFAGNDGTTLVLSDGSKVEVDGEKLKVDSSEVGGAFYKTSKPVTGFYGKHTIRFTDISGKQFDNEFTFSSFSISNSMEADRKKDLWISYQTAPLTKADHAEVFSTGTDSSFHYRQDGPDTNILIPSKELMRQKGKTLSFECKLYREIDLQQSASEGGLIRIRQALKTVKIKLLP